MAGGKRKHYHHRGKTKFATRECAEAVRGHRSARRPSWKFTVAYCCRVCGWWHLGNVWSRDGEKIEGFTP